ncbi:hypothetical protein D3C72_952500 [compost metagenome]
MDNADYRGRQDDYVDVVRDVAAAPRKGAARPPLSSHKIHQQLHIQRRNHHRDQPGEGRKPERRAQLAHLRPVGGEHDEREDGEGELQAEHHLRQDQEFGRAAVAIEDGDAGGGDDGDGAGDEAAQPGGEPHLEEAFHHDLARKRCRDGGVDATAQKRHPEQRRRNRKAKQRREQTMRFTQFGNIRLTGLVEGRRCEDEDRGVDDESKRQGDG